MMFDYIRAQEGIGTIDGLPANESQRVGSMPVPSAPPPAQAAASQAAMQPPVPVFDPQTQNFVGYKVKSRGANTQYRDPETGAYGTISWRRHFAD
jgi:hypothetical protein